MKIKLELNVVDKEKGLMYLNFWNSGSKGDDVIARVEIDRVNAKLFLQDIDDKNNVVEEEIDLATFLNTVIMQVDDE
jgi:hypothetical protein